MADFPSYRHDTTGRNLYIVIHNAAGQVWDVVGEVFENYDGTWTNYDIPAVEDVAGSYFYNAEIPANLTADIVVFVTFYERAGGSVAITDPVAADATWFHDGSTVSPLGVDIVSVDGDAAAAGKLESACDNYSATRGLTGTALPAAVADANNGLVTGDGSVTFTAGVGNRLAVDAEGISGSTAAADAVEAVFTGVGAAADVDLEMRSLVINNDAGPGFHIGGTTFGMEVTASNGPGISSVSTGGNNAGIVATGNDSGAGVVVTSGNTPTADALTISGQTSGIYVTGGTAVIYEGTAGPGLQSIGTTFGAEFSASNGPAISGVSTGGNGDGMILTKHGTGTDLNAGWPAEWDAEVQGKVNDALIANNLDHLMLTVLSGAGSPTFSEIGDGTALSWIMTATGDSSDFTPSTDSLEALQTGTVGTGAVTWTQTVEDGSSNGIDNVAVWVSTDVGGSTIVAGTKYTDTNGEVTFQLDAGTYYVWKQHGGYNFTNPETIVVTAP